LVEFEVAEPILNIPYEVPRYHWKIEENRPPEKMDGRRPAGYFYREPGIDPDDVKGYWQEIELANKIREKLDEWREERYPGTSGTTRELLEYWKRDGRKLRLFFAQLEAVETIIFLNEARADLLQGITNQIVKDEPSAARKAEGYSAFQRYACKMATGAGKTTVMAMLAAWSILNKVNDRTSRTFSDVVVVVCPNVTIRSRLKELSPHEGEASIYRKMDLLPTHLLQKMTRGKVVVTNWHVFEPQKPGSGSGSGRVVKTGKHIIKRETIRISDKSTTSRGWRYLTENDFRQQVAVGLLKVIGEMEDEDGRILGKIEVERDDYIESDRALLRRALGRDIESKKNILVFNDEAHHAYRIKQKEIEESFFDLDEDNQQYFEREATIWIDGLDKLQKERGINFCVDLSATPYYITGGRADVNKIFPWVVSDFGLTDAIESGLVKIPQLAVRDSTGAEIPGYRNIWKWILEEKLTGAEKGGRKTGPKPEAILKWANTPIMMLASLWQEVKQNWEAHKDDPRPPVFIIVCKNTKIAKVIYEWLALNKTPTGIGPANIPEFLNKDGEENTIRVDSKVAYEDDTSKTKGADAAWMRHTLDTIGKREWLVDSQGRPIYPDDFEDLAEKLNRGKYPPGRDIKCIVSVSMLTEGWDCNTVTHIIGLRPFMSQLLCEQVVGPGLGRTNYEVDGNGLLTEEIAQVFGVPFEIIPFKESDGKKKKTKPRNHVWALPERLGFEIKFPRVEGYQQAIRNRVCIDWDAIATLKIDPLNIPPEVQMKANIPTNKGRPSIFGPGKTIDISLNPFRKGRRLQELQFLIAKDLTVAYKAQPKCEVPTQVLFPQLAKIAKRFLEEKVEPIPPTDIIDVFLSPYYGYVIERLVQAIQPDVSQGEAPEVPRYEPSRGMGSTNDVDYWTSRDVRPVLKSHVNSVVADTKQWEQAAAYHIDTHDRVEAFVKNSGLGFAIPYLHEGKPHEYISDFIIRIKDEEDLYLILEIKGYYDDLAKVKEQAAERWVAAVNADGKHGTWRYALAMRPEDGIKCIDEVKK